MKPTPMTTPDLYRRLHRHYLPETEMFPGGILVPEVGENGSATRRRCDAVYVGFTSASGRIMVGHELKVSRADWLHELAQLDKASQWSDACHAWCVVAPGLDIVPAEEVPHGWGLMVVDARAKRRLKTVIRPVVKSPHTPPWWAVRSVMARQDTIRGGNEQQRVNDAMTAAVVGITEWVETEVMPTRTQYWSHWSKLYYALQTMAKQQARQMGAGDPDERQAVELVQAFAKAGVKLAHYSSAIDPAVTPGYLAGVADLLMTWAESEKLRERMTVRWAHLSDIEEASGKLRKLLDFVAQAAL